LDKQRIIVNSGTSTYWELPLRQWQRSTAAHSTVEVNGLNSSEVWGHFRVARRAYPSDVKILKNGEELSVQCSHNGYWHQARCIHTRTWTLTENTLTVTDHLSKPCQAIARYYVHPDVKLEGSSMKIPSRELTVASQAKIHSENSCYYPEFGKALSSSVMFQELVQDGQIQLNWHTLRI